MAKTFAVIGGDSRQRYLAEALRRRGHKAEIFAVPDLKNTKSTLADVLQEARLVILPMPALDKSGHLVNHTESPVSVEEIADFVQPGTVIFGGKLENAKAILSEKSEVIDYYEWDSLAFANAVPTAEGALQMAMEHTDSTIFGSHCMVIGAGRIGLCLALRLKALGASVTVTARKDADLARLRSHGLTADRTGAYLLGLHQYDCVFNTVPAPVLEESQISRLPEDCILIELASAPGGFAEDACQRQRRTYISGNSLPGRVAPKAAGELILEEILSYLRWSTWSNR